MKAIVTVVGKDRVGIIANVCTALANFNVNVLDISQTVMQGYFTMMMATEVSQCTLPLAQLCTEMERIGKPEDVLAEGQVVQVKITDVDAENKRISLSIRALLEQASEEAPVEEAEEA